MKTLGRVRSWRLPTALLLAVTAASRTGWTADDEVLADESANAQSQRQPHLVDLASNFDTNLFERHGGGWVIRGGVGQAGVVRIQVQEDPGASRRPESPALAKARSAGKKRMERIDSSCDLTEDQRRRFELAIESDARRFAAEIDEVRDRYAGRKVNMNDQAGQKEWHAFQQDVQRCRDRLRRLFDEESLFAALLESTLDERQLRCLLDERAARRTYHWQAMVAETLARLDDTLALSESQHSAIETLLLEREPPLRADGDNPSFNDGNLRRQLVLMVLSEVDAKKLRATVSEKQWQTLGNLTAQGRSMRSWIEQQGIIEAGRDPSKSQPGKRASRSR